MAGIAGFQYLFPSDFYYPKPSTAATINGGTMAGRQQEIVIVQPREGLEKVIGDDESPHVARGLSRYAMNDGKNISISTSSPASLKSLVPVLPRQQDRDQMFFGHKSSGN
ncbi:hypothetical protein LIER_40973 [Lithospermum erythrorhizon]|uniref:Uncharacterized protein n=1 Tax=Lithospermum erythrorhizon TaxID=34254 RepID=A0AAV3R5H5_LITER